MRHPGQFSHDKHASDSGQANRAGERDSENTCLCYGRPARVGSGGWDCVFASGRVSLPLSVVLI